MGLGESVRLALEGLRANKMRSILTMLGIIIGIGAVIGILTVGNGLTGSITGSMSSLGASNIMVSLQEKSDDLSPMMGIMFSVSEPEDEDLITDDMLEALRERYGELISGISLSETAGSGQAKDGRLYANLNVVGVNEQHGPADRPVGPGEGHRRAAQRLRGQRQAGEQPLQRRHGGRFGG